jgi:predicted lipoprotein with Yx(FWY)xxD motif
VRKPIVLAATATTAALLLAGCGSSSSSSSSTAASAPASSTTQSTAASTGTGAGEIVLSKHDKLGTILAAGPKKMTVYLFESDTPSSSSCSGECAKAWPPVTTSGAPTAAGGAVGADLGALTRSDGTKQVTYKGHPLYFFEKDGDAGDAYGQGSKAFGAGWYVLSPGGSKIDSDGEKGSGGSSAGGKS